MAAHYLLNRLVLIRVSGLYAFLLGAAVIIGCALFATNILKDHPATSHIPYNSAWAFLVAGIGVIGISFNKRNLALFCGVVIAGVGAMTFIQYMFGSNLGLERFAIDRLVDTYATHHDHIPPSSALCFMLIGIAMLTHSLMTTDTRRNLMCGIFGVLVLILGAVSFASFLGKSELGAGWSLVGQSLTHSSIVFMFLGAATLAYAWFQEGVELDSFSPYWLASAVAVSILVISAGLWQEMSENERRLIKLNVDEEADFLVDRIKAEMNSQMLALVRMKQRWEAHGGIPEREWRMDADNYIRHNQGLEQLELVDTNFNIVWVEKKRGAPAAKAASSYSTDVQSKLKAAQSIPRKFSFVIDKQTGSGRESLLAVLPLEEKSWKNGGYLIGRYSINQLLEAIIPEFILKSYHISVERDGVILHSSGSSKSMYMRDWGVEIPINLHEIRWKLKIWPRDSLLVYVQSGLPLVILVSGFVFAILVALTVVFAVQFYLLARRFKESEKRIRAIVNSTVDGIMTISEDGTIESYNKACEDIFGYSSDEVIGRNFKMLIPEHYVREYDNFLSHYNMTGEKNISGSGREIEGADKEGRIFPLDLSISEIILENRKIYTGVARDITDRKKYEADQARLIDKLARSNAELDDFAYIASHDLKEPLRAIYNHSCFLLEDYEDKLDEGGVKKLNRLITLTKRMEKLIYDLLYFSRLGRENLAIKETDLNVVVGDVMDTMIDVMEEKNVTINVKENLPTITCDTVRVTELYRNLIANAIKYNDNRDKRIEIGYEYFDGNVFFVKDNGIGIDEQFHRDIFRIFKRLNNEKLYGEGTGAGLTFVKKIVEHHGGEIWLSSKKGAGTTFYFTLEGKAA